MANPRRPAQRPYADPVDSDHLLFGDDADLEADGLHHDLEPPREDRHRHRRDGRRGRRRFALLMVVVAAIVIAVSAWVVVPRVVGLFSVPDYSGQGSGRVTVVVLPGDTASDIAATLVKAGVVKSSKAFVNAANDNPASSHIQPGTYVLRHHMSGKDALTLMLDPSSRSSAGDLVIPEGATVFDVEKRLVALLGSQQKDKIHAAIRSVASAGVPLGYAPANGRLASLEGFLYPATYNVDPSSSPAEVLQNMTSKFAERDRSTGFANDAKSMGLPPYEALIIASIAQSEAKFPADMPKVARVILNRLAAKRPLQIDATSRYGAMVNGDDPSTISYNTYASPYNTYLHTGLPPTPISNPGAPALDAAVHPASGDWLYYVNDDAAGHLFFTNDEAAFARAVAKCRAHNWGCG